MKAFKYLKGIGLLFLLPILASCSDSDDNSNDKNLIGTWSWIFSSGGIAGTVYSPATTGKNIDLEITSDNKYFYYTNGILSSQGTYTLETQNCIHDHTNKKVLFFSNNESMMIEKIDNSNLFLSDDNFDGFSNSYIRKNKTFHN